MPSESVQFSQTKHHRKSVTALILAIIIFGVVVAGYLFSEEPQQAQAPIVQKTPQEQLVSALNASSDLLLSADGKSQAVTELKNGKATLSNAQKLEIISSLQKY